MTKGVEDGSDDNKVFRIIPLAERLRELLLTEADHKVRIASIKTVARYTGIFRSEEEMNPKKNTMKYEVAQDNNNANEWRVEAIDFDGDGDCYVTIFGGTDSESRAREYAAWKQN